MTIDEAIEDLKYDIEIDMYIRDIAPQLAEWLEDYKRIKMLIPIEQALKAEYNKAIDDFVKALQEKIEKDLANPDLALECKKCGIWKNYDIAEIAEQLKAGGENERSI